MNTKSPSSRISIFTNANTERVYKASTRLSIHEFNEKAVYVDLGYVGIDKDYKLGGLPIPVKGPRKSKSNPRPKLTKA